MSIFIDSDTPVIVQGITPLSVATKDKTSMEPMVGRRTRKAGETVEGVPVLNLLKTRSKKRVLSARLCSATLRPTASWKRPMQVSATAFASPTVFPRRI